MIKPSGLKRPPAPRWILLGCLLALTWPGAMASESAASTSADAVIPSSTNAFTINSITVQGTNLVLAAVVPSGITQVTLDSRPTLDAGWTSTESLNLQPGATEAVFTIPKPTNSTCFFRLEASLPAQNVPLVSSQLRYVAIPSLASSLTTNGDAIFHFQGMVDGSDKIVINHEGALWYHVNWNWPQGPVAINGTQWSPQEKNYLTTIGATKFLPETFSLATADLQVIGGRDVVALERDADSLVVYVDDTPGGADQYEFNVLFHPVKSTPVNPPTAPVASLKIDAQIDGCDCLKITSQEATWIHKRWACPTDVTLNGVAWDLQQTNVLANTGTNTFLPPWVDLSTARIVSRKGRDLATMSADKDAVWVWFADNPNGSDAYELEISFGQ